MITYITISLLITSICGLAIFLLRSAPARLRFYICLLLLAAWLTPWQHLQFQAVTTAFVLPLDFLSEFNLNEASLTNTQQPPEANQPQHRATFSIQWDWLWLVSLAIGLSMFVKDIFSYRKLHKRWLHQSDIDDQVWKLANIAPTTCEIRRLNTQAPGMATGLFKPIIWLDMTQDDPEKVRTVVTHELTHIRQHDPFWLWAINLVQRMFWWNPIIWLTARYARQQIELSCDEQCKKHLPEGSYQLNLIQLTLEVNKQQPSLSMPAILQMSGSPAFNLQRIHKLNEDRKMKKRYVVVVAILLSLTGWIGLSNATVNVEPASVGAKSTHVLAEVHESMAGDNFALAEKQLQELVANIDILTASEQAKIWEAFAFVAFSLNEEDLKVTQYLDNAITLKDELSTEKLLKILDLGQKFALSQKRYDKQIAYANKWFEIADTNADKKDLLFFTALSHNYFQQYDRSAELLEELITVSEKEGYQPKEEWLGVQLGNHVKTKNLSGAVQVQEKIAQFYPSDKNDELLIGLNNADSLQ